MKLEAATFTITDDEPAWSLAEMNLSTPDFHGRHRYQIIEVVRQDRLVQWRRDLGDESLYSTPQFNIPGGYVDDDGRGHVYESVGRLREIADQMRDRTGPIEGDFEQGVTTDWAGAYHDEIDRRKRRTRKLFTPRQTVRRRVL